MIPRMKAGRGNCPSFRFGAWLSFLLIIDDALIGCTNPEAFATAYVASLTTLRRSASPVPWAGCEEFLGFTDRGPSDLYWRGACPGRRHSCRLHAKKAPHQGDKEEPASNRLDKGMNLLELASSRGGLFLPTQPLLVRTAKATWRFMWERMMSELAPQDSQGNYVRPTYTYSSSAIITSPSSSSSSVDHADIDELSGTYQLYVGNPCPWCHRAVLAARILNLEESGSVRMTRLLDDPERATRGGWVFSAKDPDPVYRCSDLRELYDRLSPGGSYTGRCTAPLLVDRTRQRIVSNESADIVRFLNRLSQQRRTTRAPDDAAGNDRSDVIDLYPPDLAAEIDAINDWVYERLNNGVYRCGFATSQAAYDRASRDVRTGLERCDDLLSRQLYLVGRQFTEADLRLLPTVLRFDGAYAPLFRAGGAHVRIASYPNLHQWLVRCWNDVPGVSGSIDVSDACSSYFRQLFPLNPGGIVPSPVTPRDLGLPEATGTN